MLLVVSIWDGWDQWMCIYLSRFTHERSSLSTGYCCNVHSQCTIQEAWKMQVDQLSRWGTNDFQISVPNQCRLLWFCHNQQLQFFVLQTLVDYLVTYSIRKRSVCEQWQLHKDLACGFNLERCHTHNQVAHPGSTANCQQNHHTPHQQTLQLLAWP